MGNEKYMDTKKLTKLTEKEKKQCGCYFTPFGKIQKEAVIESLNKTSDAEALKRSIWMKKEIKNERRELE